MMDDITFYARMGVEILAYVLAIALIVYAVEKLFGLNKTPRPGQTI